MSNEDMAGRIMAHAFHDEMEKIAKLPSWVRKQGYKLDLTGATGQKLWNFPGMDELQKNTKHTVRGMLQRKAAGNPALSRFDRATALSGGMVSRPSPRTQFTQPGGRSLEDIKRTAKRRMEMSDQLEIPADSYLRQRKGPGLARRGRMGMRYPAYKGRLPG
tara:strand:+ start:68 stop:550 length:483 start_codon:yes stop_codon:yes gene_type:complete